jgi:sulfite exporter TauE/SafE
MNPSENSFSATQRFLYGAVVGAILGTIVGTMPMNHPALGVIGLAAGALTIGGLAMASTGFWESLLAAWELVRAAFWRW